VTTKAKRKRKHPVDVYLGRVEPETRAALIKLRATILSIIPDAEQCIAYGIPAFRVDFEVVAGFAARRLGGCSYYPFSGSTLRTLARDIERYEHTKSSLHFQAASGLPKALVKKLVLARIAEIDPD
jgi:uncharacterized protein YdhG (YjbR/CyaY superfamily)